jgi:DDE superfamily endonuclease
MLRLPACFAAVILCFAPLFRQHTWRHAQVLLIGAVLVPGQRTVTSILRVSGLCWERRFVNYHRVLNRAAWSGRAAAQVLLGLLLEAFVPKGPVLLGLDDHIERRRGKRIRAKGIYRDPVRSSKGHFVKASGLRWLSLMLLVPIAWAGRVWALPFLTALAPSERYDRECDRRHKKLTDWARQLVLQARRWMPERALVLVADSSFAALELLASLVRQGVTCVTRLRLDAALYTPAPPRQPKTRGRPRSKGARLPTLAQVLADPTTAWQRVTVPDWYGEGERVVEICSETAVWRHSGLPVVPIRWVLLRDPSRRFDPQALLCTDLAQEPLQIVRWFVQRWQLEVTFREVRDHLGVETQRQWSDKAIARTTPCLLGLFSVVILLATRLSRHARLQASAAAWYHKQRPTFADTLAAVRRQLWCEQGFLTSRRACKPTKLRSALRDGIVHALCYAA